jgi:hypothetical protein
VRYKTQKIYCSKFFTRTLFILKIEYCLHTGSPTQNFLSITIILKFLTLTFLISFTMFISYAVKQCSLVLFGLTVHKQDNSVGILFASFVQYYVQDLCVLQCIDLVPYIFIVELYFTEQICYTLPFHYCWTQEQFCKLWCYRKLWVW